MIMIKGNRGRVKQIMMSSSLSLSLLLLPNNNDNHHYHYYQTLKGAVGGWGRCSSREDRLEAWTGCHHHHYHYHQDQDYHHYHHYHYHQDQDYHHNHHYHNHQDQDYLEHKHCDNFQRPRKSNRLGQVTPFGPCWSGEFQLNYYDFQKRFWMLFNCFVFCQVNPEMTRSTTGLYKQNNVNVVRVPILLFSCKITKLSSHEEKACLDSGPLNSNTWGKRHPPPLSPLVVFVSAMSTRSGWVAWGRTSVRPSSAYLGV